MSGEWELHYHAGLAGRGEYARLIFEEAQVKYKNVTDKIQEIFREGKQEGIYPSYAPPMIKKGNFNLSQTSVICEYLGKQFGLYPTNEEDIWHAKQVNVTIHDFIGEGRLVFHGRNFVESYFTQKQETKPYIAWFVKDRLPKWLAHFEKTLAANSGGKGFLFGDKITYVDLGLFHALRATESTEQFREEWENNKNIPLLKAFKDRIAARPNIAAYLISDRCIPLSGNSMM